MFLLILSAIVSGLLSYFQYFYRTVRNSSLFLPAFLRFVSIFSLFVLLINPKYYTQQYNTIKPGLQIALDGSKSMSLTGGDSAALNLIESFRSDPEINKRFDLEYYVFGSGLRRLDTIRFSQSQTDIDQALTQLGELSASKISPVVLISDGIQTFGKDYFHSKFDQKVFPVITGDTLRGTDLEISLVNANSYATLGNTFEAEVFVNFSGSGSVNSVLVIEHQGDVIANRRVTLSEGMSSQQVVFEIEASQEGIQLYRARIRPVKGERETRNNQETFEVKVIDEKTEIALVYAFPHPDLGMIKQSLEIQEKKRVELIPVSEWNEEKEEYAVYMIYQPDSRFQELFTFMEKRRKNFFLIAGPASDWYFLNKVLSGIEKENSALTDDFFPVFAEDFQSFYIEDIGFSEFPSLTFNLGQIKFNLPHEPILRQAINGIETDQPMLTVFEENEGRRIMLFGENIWKWRLYTYRRDNDFQRFDRFLGSLVQYLYLSNKRQDLELFYDKSGYDDQEVMIRARKYDANLNLDLSSPLELYIDGKEKAFPMYVNRSFYEVRLGNLLPGEHEFRVTDVSTGVSQRGRFEILPYSAEQMTLTADVAGMNYLSEQTGGQSFYPTQIENLKRTLLEDPDFKPVEKVERKRISLVDQKWLLALIVLSLSIEWIIRKYRGLV